MRVKLMLIAALLAGAGSAFGLGPHELLVLVNTNSASSVKIAGHYARQRKIPAGNVVGLSVPESAVSSGTISPEDFGKFIWRPAVRAAAERGIAGGILAWAYSSDFPAAVKLNPPISIQGMTFLRNAIPAPEDVGQGRYRSPLFCGPNRADGSFHFSQSFDLCREWIGGDWPLPSMMLGYVGRNGNTVEEVLASLDAGLASDRSAPTGTVYFVVSEDIRSKCRDWQFSAVQAELKALNVEALIVREFPRGRNDVAGLMMGEAVVNGIRGNRYLPGCMAEHLTSAAAVFDSEHQTKLTAWLAAGATSSAGAVTEPLSIWTKFPSARFFAHYASGCTMIESYFQSIRCPLQILLVGDPLAQPWAPKAEMALEEKETGGDPGVVTVRAAVKSEDWRVYGRYCFLLDGKPAQDGSSETFSIEKARLGKGSHAVRAVAYGTGFVRSQVFAEIPLRPAGP